MVLCVVLNPWGAVAENVGQVFECLLGWAAQNLVCALTDAVR